MSEFRDRTGSMSRRVSFAVLAAILLLAAFFRLQGLRWDAACPPDTTLSESACTETHLHPDERFLTMVASAIELPDSVGDYFDARNSSANPHNRGFGFFAYGLFPVLSVHAVATTLGLGGYDQVHLVGRGISALCSLLTLGLLYVLAVRLYDKTIARLSTLLLALAVLPIQQAHFFTVDSMATTASMLALLCAVSIAERGRWRDHGFFGLALGLAVAVKVSVFTLALLAVAATWAYSRSRGSVPTGVTTRRDPGLAGLAVGALVSIAVFRLLSPYAFSGPGIFGLALNPDWLANMREVGQLVGGWRDFPPGHQWTDRAPLWFPWKNMVLVGLGPALGIAAWTGWIVAGFLLLRRGQRHHLLPWLWIAVLFAHQGTQWAKSLRYLLPIYPALALFAAFLLVATWRAAQRSGRGFARAGAALLAGAVLIGTLAWAWAFTSIYRRPHSRVEASRWIYQNVPEGDRITHEIWDDPLPVPLDGMPGMARYRGLPMHPYAEDSPQKLDEMLATLDEADLVVLSSNRTYDSIARLPMRYPATLRYYDALFSGELGFERVAEFTSYPQLFGIPIPDQGAEEAFSVYDHPRVQLFARTAAWDRARAHAILDVGDWDEILQLTPREVALYKDLQLPPDRLERQQAGGTWKHPAEGTDTRGASPLFPESRGPWVSIVLWILVLEWLGLIAFPLALPAFGSLTDRGWLLSKTLGLLLVSYLAWLGGSLDWVTFTPSTLRWIGSLLTLVALAATWRQRHELRRFARRRWRTVAIAEFLFWSFFAFLLALRFMNPDLWHPFRGGEKPMDLAYLNAVVRSTSFPPYDPWFAGGALNYYYFGYVLAGSLSLLARVPTAVAYNLAVPTFFALTAAGAMSAAGALISRKSSTRPRDNRWLAWGAAGAAALLLVGNQGVPRLIAQGLSRMSKVDFPSRLPLVPEVARWIDGLALRISGTPLRFPDHWWYWSPSRVIPHPPTEASPITEFPLFTFLFADLHAHLMAMPIVLLTLATLTALVVAVPETNRRATVRQHRILSEATALAILALAVGSLAAINTWDLPTALGLTGLALLTREVQRSTPVRAIVRAGWRFALVAIVGRVLFLPFHVHFASGYGRIEPWLGSRTPFSSFLIVHALFLLPISTWLVIERRPWQKISLPWVAGWPPDRLLEFWGLILSALVLAFGLPLESLLLALIALAGSLALARDEAPHRRLVAVFVLTGATLALAVEHFVLVGDISRMNTVFKTYLQIWILWSLASTFALADLLRRWRTSERRKAEGGLPAWAKSVACLWLVLLLGAVAYPVMGIPARIRDRWEQSIPRGLDGRAFMDSAVYRDENGPIELRWDAQAIRWLDQNVRGSPVVLEATVPIYRWGSRISVHTGLPTVLGWDWHQQQQRAILKNDPVGRRRADVATLFSASGTEEILPLLRRYRVRYIIIGQLERLTYPTSGLDKFTRGEPFREVYRNSETIIYEVDPTALSG